MGRNVRLEYDAATGETIVLADGWRYPLRIDRRAMSEFGTAEDLRDLVHCEDQRRAAKTLFKDGRHECRNFK